MIKYSLPHLLPANDQSEVTNLSPWQVVVPTPEPPEVEAEPEQGESIPHIMAACTFVHMYSVCSLAPRKFGEGLVTPKYISCVDGMHLAMVLIHIAIRKYIIPHDSWGNTPILYVRVTRPSRIFISWRAGGPDYTCMHVHIRICVCMCPCLLVYMHSAIQNTV